MLARIAWKNHKNGAQNPKAQFQARGADGARSCSSPKRRRSARHHGLLGRLRRLGGGDRRPRRGRAQVPEGPDLHQGALVRRRARRRPPRTQDYDFTTFREVVASAADAYQQAGITRSARADLAWPRCTTASRRPSSCSTRTSASARAAPRGRTCSTASSTSRAACPVNPDGGLKSFGHPIGASGLRMMYEMLAAAPRRGRPAPDREPEARADAQPRWISRKRVSFVSVARSRAGLTVTRRRFFSDRAECPGADQTLRASHDADHCLCSSR